MKEVKIGNKKIGEGEPCFIIAEMAWSHDGSLEKAMKIVESAAEAKADAICMHFTSVKDYMTEDYGLKKGVSVDLGKETVYHYLERVNLKENEWKKLVDKAKKLRLSVCIMCNDLHSVDFASSAGADALIIPPAAIVEENLVRRIGSEKKPVLVRIGGATMSEVEQDIKWLKEEGNDNIILIYGFQNFPTPLEEMNLRFIKTLKKMHGYPVGFADHVDADSRLSIIVPVFAVGAGANLIEKHVTHDRSIKGEDYESALNPDEMKEMVSLLRETEKSLGSPGIRNLSPQEKEYRLIARKRAVAANDIKPGTIISKDMILIKRANDGIYPDEIRKILGKKSKAIIKKDEGISFEKVE